MIQRKTYLAQLEAVCNQDLIKVVTGIRRCGKSTLMMEFQELLKSKGVDEKCILSLNFEERENSQFEDWRIVYDLIITKLPSTEKKYVFLDEVQLIPHFEKLVDALYVNKDIDLYITGSNAYLLSSELTTLLSGRYIAINLHPFSFAEYATAFEEQKDTSRLFRQYMNASCFPEATNLSKISPELTNTYLKSLYETIVVKDISKRHHLRKFDTLQRIINFLFDSIGSIISPNNIADELKRVTKESLSHNTVQKYIRFFTESYLIYPVQLFNIKGKRLLASNCKYYVVDLGLKNILQTNKVDTDLGHKLENVVYFELMRRGGEVYVGKSEDNEVDFVVKKYDGQLEYYQVAYTVNDEKTLERELSSLRKIRDNYPKYLLTTDFDNSIIDGIKKINLIDWLLDSK
ncbi:MAG: ATP-binding protein [Bacteroidales bacterium]|nr:ATP-binding protein [Bacteroidales bacterium]MBR6226897.1 ATP-binding protein [Bacteroidales bacterium]